MIPSCSKTIIPLSPNFLPDNCNFFFHPTIQANLILYVHIINYRITKILVINTFNSLLHIPKHQKLGHIVDICYKNCILGDVQIPFNSLAFLSKAQLFFNLHAGIRLALTDMDTSIEIQLNNGMKIYRDKVAFQEILELVAQYLSIWKFKSFV